MKWLLRGGYRILVDRCLPGVWQWLIGLGAVYTGSLYCEESQVVAALGQVGHFVDSGTVGRVRPPEGLLEGFREGALGHPGPVDAN